MCRLLPCLLFFVAACSPRCGGLPPGLPLEAPGQALEVPLLEASEVLAEEGPPVYPLLREPSPEELHALGVAFPAEYQARTQAFGETLERLASGKLKERALILKRLSEDNPWHSLAEPAAFAAVSVACALGSCEETLEAGLAFVQAWPHGAYAAEAWLCMALCQKQAGHFAEFEETLRFVSHRYPRTPAGLKAKIELGLRASINELK